LLTLFFFQAEDGIRDDLVTGVQTCALPISRVKERFGIGHVVSVLRGENTEGIRKWGHEKLSTYGLLPDCHKADVRDWIYQLMGQIGRASCRERGESAGVAEVLRKEKRATGK